MVDYSFYSHKAPHTSTKEEAIELLKTTNKVIKYTFGYKYRHPTTYEVPVSSEEALGYFERNWTDVKEYEDWIDVNSYSDNDMW